jgi:zinc transport system permease protein
MLLDIFQYDFMIRAFLAGAIISFLAPILGIFLVVRKYSLIADTLSHISLLGIILGFILGFYPLLSAVFISCLVAFLMEKMRIKKNISGDSILAIFLSGSLALALFLLSFSGGVNNAVLGFLFGSITTVLTQDLYFIFFVALITLLIIIFYYNNFFVSSIDNELARVSGIKVDFFNILLVVLVSLVVSISIKVVGALLIGSMMVIPVTAALQLKQGFKKTIIFACLISFVSVITGLFVSYYFNIVSGAAIVMTALLFLFLSMIFGEKLVLFLKGRKAN